MSSTEQIKSSKTATESLVFPVMAFAVLVLTISSWEWSMAGARVTSGKLAIVAVFLYWLATNRHRLVSALVRVRPVLIPSAVLITASVISWTAATDLTAAILETIQLGLILVCLIIPFADSIRTTDSAKLVLYAALAALAIASVIAISGYKPLPRLRIAGLDGHPNTLGSQLSFAVPATAVLVTQSKTRLRHVAGLLLLSLLTAALILTFSRAGILAAAVAILPGLVLLPMKCGLRSATSRNLAIAVACIIVTSVALNIAVIPRESNVLSRLDLEDGEKSWARADVLPPLTISPTSNASFSISDGSALERIELLKTALKMLHDYPLTGVGGDNYITRLPEYWSAAIPWGSGVPPYRLAHWTLAQVAAEFGVLGLTGISWLILVALWFPLSSHLRAVDPGRRHTLLALVCGTLGIVTSSMLGHLFTSGIEEFFAVLVAAGTGLTAGDRVTQPSSVAPREALRG